MTDTMMPSVIDQQQGGAHSGIAGRPGGLGHESRREWAPQVLTCPSYGLRQPRLILRSPYTRLREDRPSGAGSQPNSIIGTASWAQVTPPPSRSHSAPLVTFIRKSS